jgi:transcriptional regulator with XRE-family HTH domain
MNLAAHGTMPPPSGLHAAIGRRIRLARHRSGLSRLDLACLCGATLPDVRAWEDGRDLEAHVLIAVVTALEISIGELFR